MYKSNSSNNLRNKNTDIRRRPRRSIAFSQNFINNKQVVKTLLDEIDLSKENLVVEIGPGKGIITDALVERANKIIAVEIDSDLSNQLKLRYEKNKGVSIINEDFLRYTLPNVKFNIVANIPFNITAEIIRKITDQKSLLQAAYIITEKKAAYKFIGAPYAESPLLAHFLHIHFEVKYLKEIDKSNFTPEPRVEIGFISIIKRESPIFDKTNEIQFRDLLTYIFARTGATLKEVLKSVFSNLQTKIIIEKLNLPENISKKKVIFSDWVEIYNTFILHSPEKSKYNIRGAYDKLKQDQSNLQSHNKKIN